MYIVFYNNSCLEFLGTADCGAETYQINKYEIIIKINLINDYSTR